MTKKYNVGCSIGGTGIYAFGKPDKGCILPKEKSNVTNDCIYAVTQYMIMNNRAGVSIPSIPAFLVATDNLDEYHELVEVRKKYLDKEINRNKKND